MTKEGGQLSALYVYIEVEASTYRVQVHRSKGYLKSNNILVQRLAVTIIFLLRIEEPIHLHVLRFAELE